GSARAGAGRIQPRELWPFRPQLTPVRAFHLAHPALRRSHRPSRADPRAERRAMAAERETVDRVIAAHLADRVGAIFAGRIAGVTRVGLFVKLSETGADGFVPAATLGDEYFRFEEANRALVGTRTKETFRLGAPVT